VPRTTTRAIASSKSTNPNHPEGRRQLNELHRRDVRQEDRPCDPARRGSQPQMTAMTSDQPSETTRATSTRTAPSIRCYAPTMMARSSWASPSSTPPVPAPAT
jgi:hypothetical protein